MTNGLLDGRSAVVGVSLRAAIRAESEFEDVTGARLEFLSIRLKTILPFPWHVMTSAPFQATPLPDLDMDAFRAHL